MNTPQEDNKYDSILLDEQEHFAYLRGASRDYLLQYRTEKIYANTGIAMAEHSTSEFYGIEFNRLLITMALKDRCSTSNIRRDSCCVNYPY